MHTKKTILAIIGSASAASSCEKLAARFAEQLSEAAEVVRYNTLKVLPHFDPDLAVTAPPEEVVRLRNYIADAAGVLICTPEYVFSIPSGLKNAIEWCVATTVFSEKPVGLITAAASGIKGHEELQLILQTVGASFTEATTLLIQGVKGKINQEGQITDTQTAEAFARFVSAFKEQAGL
ncbi:NADPH-dependent FMN reductase [Niabella beijingensis]|uniref:NADPH-dependent FMN reductase n=1 Tax=Niabella beijingensis TaxID=2872700 RepID=UPI001CC04824|nr:NADPH-dependent FMN reductase [Niabella beijingensis]MBZ4187259.1 NAD(P)H-dependent oxidoreductase [Niabella beijingensis]